MIPRPLGNANPQNAQRLHLVRFALSGRFLRGHVANGQNSTRLRPNLLRRQVSMQRSRRQRPENAQLVAKNRRVDPGRSRERKVGFSQTKPSLLGDCRLMESLAGPPPRASSWPSKSNASVFPDTRTVPSPAENINLRNSVLRHGVSDADPGQEGAHTHDQQAGPAFSAAQLQPDKQDRFYNNDRRTVTPVRTTSLPYINAVLGDAFGK